MNPPSPASSTHRKRLVVQRAEGVSSFNLSKQVSKIRGMQRSRQNVLRALADRYPNIWPSIETLSAESGYGRSVTRESLRDLEAAGIITSLGDKRGGRGNSEQYFINVDRILEIVETQQIPPALRKKPNGNSCLNPTETVAFIPETQRFLSEKATETVGEQRSNRSSKENREERTEKTKPTTSLSDSRPETHGQDEVSEVIRTLGESGGSFVCYREALAQILKRYEPWQVFARWKAARERNMPEAEFLTVGFNIGEPTLIHDAVASKNEAAMNTIKDKILTYDSELGRTPPVNLVLSWARPLERELQQKHEQAENEINQERNRRAVARQERLDYLAGPERDRIQILEEARTRQQKVEARRPFVPEKSYSEAEIAAMSADEYKRLVLGADNLRLNESRPDEQMREYTKQRILKAKKNDPLSRAIRHEIRRGLK